MDFDKFTPPDLLGSGVALTVVVGPAWGHTLAVQARVLCARLCEFNDPSFITDNIEFLQQRLLLLMDAGSIAHTKNTRIFSRTKTQIQFLDAF